MRTSLAPVFLGLLTLTVAIFVGSHAYAQDDAGGADVDAVDGEAVTLEQLLEYAEQNAPDIQLARKRVRLGRASVDGAERFQPFNPELEGEVGIGLDDPGVRRAEVTLKQRLEIAGERGLRIEAAQLGKQALESELDEARWSVHQRIHRLYRQALLDRKQVEVEREALAFTQRLRRFAQQRFDAGEAARTAVVVAQAEVARSRQRRVKSSMDYEQTVRELATTVAWDKDALPEPAGEPAKAKPAPDEAPLLEKAYANDPRLVVLRTRLEQARAELAVEQREVWPNPMVGLGFERENLGTSAVASQIRFIVGIPLPLWNRNQGGIALADARTEVFTQAIENRKNVLENRVREQAAAVDAAYRQAQIYQEEVLPALETQLELLQEGFKLGELSLLDVMNARDRLLAVQRQYLTALHEYYAAISQLEELLGTAIWNENDNQ